MNAFLVIARCDLDDVPLRLFASSAEAAAYAAGVDQVEVRASAARLLGVDVTAVYGVDVVEFEAGLPLPVRKVKDFGRPR